MITIAIIIVLIAFVVFREIMSYNHIKRLETLLYLRTTPDSLKSEQKRVKEELKSEEEQATESDNYISLEDVDPKRLLDVLPGEKEEFVNDV